MALLSDEQVECAVDVVIRSYNQSRSQYGIIQREGFRRSVCAAAPYLQMPWDEPTDAEVLKFLEIIIGNASAGNVKVALSLFVRVRNATLLPKPIDPRRERIIEVLRYYPDRAPEIADKILAAIDEVK